MFQYCESLTSLPDILKWDTSKVSDMSEMFKNCKSLNNLPDISKWNTSKLKDKEDMFDGCNENTPTKFFGFFKKKNNN
jgi:surface protein